MTDTSIAPPFKAPASSGHEESALSTEEMCGRRVGDRRVRVQRQPRSVVRKVASAVRRTFSR